MKALFSVFLNATFYGSVMILMALLLRLILRKAPRRILGFLWLFVMVRLLLPIPIESKLSLQPQTTPVQTIVEQLPQPPSIPTVHPSVTPSPEIPSVPDVVTPAQPVLHITDILPWVWFGVMCAIFVYMAFSYSLLRYQIRDAVPCEKGIWETDRIPGAFILGYLQPQIYLPAGLAPIDRQLIIAHERSHIRRGDVWWKLLGMLCLCMHWYNPLVWLAYGLMSRDIEAACDEQVIRIMPLEQRKAYSYALVNASKRMSGIFVSPVAFSEVNLKQRIKKVLSYRHPGVLITIAAIVISALIVIFFMTNPTTEQQDTPVQDTTATIPTEATENSATPPSDGPTENPSEYPSENPTEPDSTTQTVHVHDWKNATCMAPKTCRTCGATEGTISDHTYTQRKCTTCGVLLPTEELRYSLNWDNKSYLCYGYDGTDPIVVIPAMYHELPVTILGPLYSTTLTNITLPNTITTIGDRAFMGVENLQSITLPTSVTSIELSAFVDCVRLTSITLSPNLTTIGNSAFSRCSSLTSIHIPASVTSIGADAFQNCTQLYTITFAGTVAQWNAIQKGANWNSADWDNDWIYEGIIPASGVTCSDGFVPF